jgi:hypothetical protein
LTSFRLVPVRAQRNTNEGVVRVRHVLDDDIEVAVSAPTPEGKTEVHASVAAGVPDVSAKCSLLKWVEQSHKRRQVKEALAACELPRANCRTDDIASSLATHQERPRKAHTKSRLGHARHWTRGGKKKERWFGEYSEEEPDEYLLLQDLIALHRRGVEDVSVTILSDDAPFDIEPLVGPAGRSHSLLLLLLAPPPRTPSTPAPELSHMTGLFLPQRAFPDALFNAPPCFPLLLSTGPLPAPTRFPQLSSDSLFNPIAPPSFPLSARPPPRPSAETSTRST